MMNAVSKLRPKCSTVSPKSDETINEALQNAVLYKVYDTSEAFERYRSDPRFAD